MTVAEQTRVNSHTGNGVTTNFAYSYRIFEDTDLQVVVDGVLKTLTTDYTVNGAGDDVGGSIDFVTAPINLSVVTISGELTYDREIDYIENGGMRSQTVDDDFDKAVMLIQQLRRDVDRSIKVPIEETDDKEISATAAERANKVQGFDAAGLPIVSTITDLSSILTTVDASLVLAAEQLSVAIPNRHCVAGGTADVITGATTPVATALTNNLRVWFEASGANTITTPTFDLDGLGDKTIVKGNNLPLRVGDLAGANARADVIFDASLNKWVLLNPALTGDAADKVVIQAGGYNYSAETGVADAYVVTLTPVPTAYATPMPIITKIVNANLTTTPTLKVNGLAIKNIKRPDGSNPVVGDLPANHWAEFIYDGTNQVLQNPATLVDHDHSAGGEGGAMLGAIAATDITIIGSAASPPDANTIVKESLTNFWVTIDMTGTAAILDSYNCTGIVDEGAGDVTATIDTDFANANWCCQTSCSGDPSTNAERNAWIDNSLLTTGSVRVQVTASGTSNDDVDYVSISGNGAQS